MTCQIDASTNCREPAYAPPRQGRDVRSGSRIDRDLRELIPVMSKRRSRSAALYSRWPAPKLTDGPRKVRSKSGSLYEAPWAIQEMLAPVSELAASTRSLADAVDSLVGADVSMAAEDREARELLRKLVGLRNRSYTLIHDCLRATHRLPPEQRNGAMALLRKAEVDALLVPEELDLHLLDRRSGSRYTVSTAKGNALYYRRQGKSKSKAATFQPVSKSWLTFWSRMELCRPWTWETRYQDTSDIARYQWSIVLRSGKREARSSGDGYPRDATGTCCVEAPTFLFQTYVEAVLSVLRGRPFC